MHNSDSSKYFCVMFKWPYYAVLPCDLANGKHKKTLQPVNLVLRFREKDVALCEASCYRKFIYSMFPPTNRQPSAHQRWNPLAESVFTSFSQAIGTQGKWKTDSSCMIYHKLLQTPNIWGFKASYPSPFIERRPAIGCITMSVASTKVISTAPNEPIRIPSIYLYLAQRAGEIVCTRCH